MEPAAPIPLVSGGYAGTLYGTPLADGQWRVTGRTISPRVFPTREAAEDWARAYCVRQLPYFRDRR